MTSFMSFPFSDEVDFKGGTAEEMNPSEHSYELYLHAERSADQVSISSKLNSRIFCTTFVLAVFL